MLFHARRAKNEQKSISSTDYGWTVVHPTDRCEPVTTAYSFSLACVAEINQAYL